MAKASVRAPNRGRTKKRLLRPSESRSRNFLMPLHDRLWDNARAGIPVSVAGYA
jgi:hypothetical protein